MRSAGKFYTFRNFGATSPGTVRWSDRECAGFGCTRLFQRIRIVGSAGRESRLSTGARVVGDVTLEVLEQGDGPALLFLHGEDGHAFTTPVIEQLAADFRVIAPTHPAWEGSTRPDHIEDVRDIASVYVELIEQLDEPPIVLGCSLGGWIAAELAVQARDLIAGLILVSPVGVKLGDRETRDFVDLWVLDFADLIAINYRDASHAPDMTALTEADYQYLAVASEATARYCWKPYMHDPKLRHRLRRVAVPSLVVNGGADAFTLLSGYFDRYGALIGSGAARLELPQAGRRIEEEEPAELARIVREFAVGVTNESAAVAAGKGR